MYCENCGKKLKENEVCDCTVSNKEKDTGVIQNKKLLIGIATGLCVAVFLIVFLCTRPKSVDLAEYMIQDIEMEGFNGQFSIGKEALFDSSSFGEMLLSQASGTTIEDLDSLSDEEIETEFMDAGLTVVEAEQVVESIKFVFQVNGKTVEALEGLSNGDKIFVEVSVQPEVNTHFNLRFKKASVQFEIEGLSEGNELDVFDELEVSFKGVNGDGTVLLSYPEDLSSIGEINFYTSKYSSKYSNGDVVTIYAEYDKELFAQNGYFLKEESREYTVSGLGEFVKDIKELSEQQIKLLQNAILEEMNDNFHLVFMGALDKISYEKTYFGVLKTNTDTQENEDDENDFSQNVFYVVGSYTDEDDNQKHYCISSFENIALDGNGKLSVGHMTEEQIACDNVQNWGMNDSDLDILFNQNKTYDFVQLP